MVAAEISDRVAVTLWDSSSRGRSSTPGGRRSRSSCMPPAIEFLFSGPSAAGATANSVGVSLRADQFPFPSESVLLGRIALLASRHDVASGRTPTARERYHVVHGERVGSAAAPTVVADPSGSLPLPPLCATELSSARPLASDVLAVGLSGEVLEQRRVRWIFHDS